MEAFGRLLTRLGVFTAHPAAFLRHWAISAHGTLLSPWTFDWPAGVAMTTLFMTLLLIQRKAEHFVTRRRFTRSSMR